MRLLPSDPDIETIVSRVKAGDIDLQPDFQRGEVWSRSKKQRLIDSILRDWHVPPIHVIEDIETRKQEVLDGQQRLAAIRDFIDGEFALDGGIEPIDNALLEIHGRKYRDLPETFKRRFNQFTIRLFRIVDYKPGEPGELFFRLNQPTSLTGAEQRNAFFGPVRSQIKNMVKALDDMGLDKSFLGFSNSRMAYDDVLSRVAITLQRGTLNSKITSTDLADLYRSECSLNPWVENTIFSSMKIMSNCIPFSTQSMKFNKATLYSWMMFIARCTKEFDWFDGKQLAELIDHFENSRLIGTSTDEIIFGIRAEILFNVYESRSSARVADVSSVLLRDAVIWILFSDMVKGSHREVAAYIHRLTHALTTSLRSGDSFEEDAAARAILESGWGTF
ncbi:DUF262 domain-containing protein [Pseudomonas aeruginosa]|uniref:DUF262 domain-containing protein n=1 Tax=Pseudomonas aeruginosa TaxID=287 RepID=UPI0009374387|nr:DUF262 domain-containing protein [Pseudomonas aeruginosa]EIU3788655.1 DUF262 domain-containing protein [Pseudomonas aeruginosa]EKV0488648.1 DUF262 domain-containing protein [Pseudomonas aeruginosa]MCQ9780421.1 DUF262 domain-containing protein [Pseudomonas aeruginosa]MCQ9832338.1 DUF262 domain-containing protein [Pseudomonas aeruginosa]MCQ9847402.1 DUF262 domain-containing protein [Pseudomonas aeruginosa]